MAIGALFGEELFPLICPDAHTGCQQQYRDGKKTYAPAMIGHTVSSQGLILKTNSCRKALADSHTT
jgi:hypothetical protein